MSVLHIHVPGIALPGGSKRGFPIRRKGGGIGVSIVDANPKVAGWRQLVALAARMEIEQHEDKASFPLSGPIDLHVEIVLPRPKAHYRASKRAGTRTLREDAPAWHASKPDTTKLLRALEDALSGIAWFDDSQVAMQSASKRYGEVPGVQIRIEPLMATSEPRQMLAASNEKALAATSHQGCDRDDEPDHHVSVLRPSPHSYCGSPNTTTPAATIHTGE